MFNQKLILVYLYQTIPSFIIQKTIRLEAGICKETKQQIQLTGQSKYPQKFQVNINFPHSNNSCQISSNLNQIYLEPQRQLSIELSIKPQFIKDCFAIVQI